MKRIYILLIISIIFLTSCSKEKEYIKDFNEQKTNNSTGDTYQLSWEDLDMSISQNNSVNRTSAYSNSGYYFISWQKIYYYDYATNKGGIWCNKIGCEHITEDCSAVLSFDKNSTNFIFYQNGKVYLLGIDEDGYFIESYNEDGSNYEKLCRLWTNNSCINLIDDGYDGLVELSNRCIALHEGKAYYAVSDMNTIVLYETELKYGAKQKELCRFDKEEYDVISMDKMKLFDDYITLQIIKSKSHEGYGEINYEEVEALYAVNINEGTAKVMIENSGSFYDVNDKYVYVYVMNLGLYKIDIENGNKEFLIKEDVDCICNIFVSDDYIITFPTIRDIQTQKRYIKIYNYNLELLDSVECKGMEDICGFDGRFIYGFRQYDYKNTPNYMNDDSLLDSLWSVEDIGKEEKKFFPMHD